jgi:hypothetical protein
LLPSSCSASRNAWRNSVPPITASEVGKTRKALVDRKPIMKLAVPKSAFALVAAAMVALGASAAHHPTTDNPTTSYPTTKI